MQTKKWWQSKTIWGVLIAALGFLLNQFLKVDIQLPQSDVVSNTDFQTLLDSAQKVKDSQGSLGVILAQVLVVVGLVLGVYGRLKTKTTIE
jgi:hypothetical protein